jgi:hypothetical protein
MKQGQCFVRRRSTFVRVSSISSNPHKYQSNPFSGAALCDGTSDEPCVIAFVTDPDGYKIELIQRADSAAGGGLR